MRRQDKPLALSNENTRVFLNNIILPGFAKDLLAYGQKHPIMEEFNELRFLAAIDNLIRNLRENNVPGEKLFETETLAKWFTKNIRETPLDRESANT